LGNFTHKICKPQFVSSTNEKEQNKQNNTFGVTRQFWNKWLWFAIPLSLIDNVGSSISGPRQRLCGAPVTEVVAQDT